MIRDNALGLAAVVAAVLSVGGALAIVQAQQPAGGTASPGGRAAPAAGTASKKSGAMHGGARAGASGSKGMAPSGMPGSGMGMMGSMMGGGMAVTPVDDDPEMTELALTEDALSYEAEEIVARYAESEDAPERKTIAAELKETLTKQFDVQRQRRELELGRIEERVKKLRDQIKKRSDARDTIIGRRLDQLVTEAEGLGWAPAAGSAPRNQTFPYFGGARGRGGSGTDSSAPVALPRKK